MHRNFTDMQLAVETAETVGLEVIMPIFAERDLDVLRKADNSPVTRADKNAEIALREMLRQPRPNYGWLSEESDNDRARLTCERVWIVDPIDGTNSFIRKSDEFAISIGVAERTDVGEYHPVVGVVHMPAQKRTISAAHGCGVYVDGKLRQRDEQNDLDNAILTFAHGSRNKADIDLVFGAGSMQRNVVASIALRLAEVGVGQSDLGLTAHKLSEWDIAAGDAICREAGLKVTDLNGDTIVYNKADPTVEGIIMGPVVHHRTIVEMCADAGLSGEVRGTRAWSE